MAENGEANASPGTGAADGAVRPVEFPDLGAVHEGTAPAAANLEMIRDIQVTMRVELGRTCMLIEDVLALTPGKVIELDKLAGEPLDVLVNNKLVARGEVVVVDDKFGVRITSITDPRARVQAMGNEGGT